MNPMASKVIYQARGTFLEIKTQKKNRNFITNSAVGAIWKRNLERKLEKALEEIQNNLHTPCSSVSNCVWGMQ